MPVKSNSDIIDYKISDIKLADFGRKEINLAEYEMPGLMALRKKLSNNISYPLHIFCIFNSIYI